MAFLPFQESEMLQTQLKQANQEKVNLIIIFSRIGLVSFLY